MNEDTSELHQLNLEMGRAEAEGNVAFFEHLLASTFAMRRASGQIIDRTSFLLDVKKSADRPTEILSISFLGKYRAAVTCIITLNESRYDNFRLFSRQAGDMAWKLLAWANEPLR